MAPIQHANVAFVVRHGERLDHVSQAWHPDPALGLWDPPLSDKGHEQADRTGQHLVQLMQESNVELSTAQIAIYTSPFERCLQTALAIARHLPARSTTLRLELGLGEWMSDEFFSEPPSPASRLIARQQEALARKQLASYKTPCPMPHVDYAHPSISNQFVYPESYVDMLKRVDAARSHCLQRPQQDVAVFVTHAICCHALLDGFRGCQTRPLEAAYCSVSRIVRSHHNIHTPPPSPPTHDDRSPWTIDLLLSSAHLPSIR